MINTSLSYLESGLSVIPVQIDTKQPPKGFSWKKYQFERMTPDQAFSLFSESDGIAIICGAISGNLEVIDFDNHQGTAKQNFTRFCKIPEIKSIIEGMTAEKTQSGGYHLLYRCDSIEGNKKIAQTLYNGKPDTIIESRGEGGYIVAAPSKGYELIGHSKMTSIKQISPDERELMHEFLHSFNEFVRPEQTFFHDTFNSQDERPGDDYNNDSKSSDEAKALLNHAGWHTSNGTHWTRPDKKKGVSATFGKVTAGGIPLFYCFSSNAYPFQDGKSYKPFQIFGLLAHNGNFEDAAKELSGRGYGKQIDPKYKEAYQRLNKANKAGIKPQTAAADIAVDLDLPPDQMKEIAEKIYEANKDEFDFDKKPAIEKAEIFLRKHYEFRYNVVSMMREMRRGSGIWEDLNEDTLYRDLQYNFIKFGSDNIKSLMRSDFVPDYNPFTEYFASLPAYDGENHFGKLAEFVDTPDRKFFASMLLKHMVRAIKCALEDSYYNRIVFTLLGPTQEIGKSYFVNWLNPFGSKYYTDEMLTVNKDSLFALSENLIYNLEELDSLSKMDIGKLKAIISKRGVKDRPAYARQKISMPRRCTFFGSTNREEFLIDDSNTRWLVFKVDSIDWNYSKELNVQDLWCQAYAHYLDKSFDCELTADEKAWRDSENHNYQVMDIERSLIIENFEPSHNPDIYRTPTEIILRLGEIVAGRIRLNTTSEKIGRIMASLKYKSHIKYKDGQTFRVYYVKERILIPSKNEELPF